MKKIFSISAIAIVTFALSSCYRSYTCTCQYKTSAGRDTTFIEDNIHKGQSGALHECDMQKQRLIGLGSNNVMCGVPI